MIEDRKVKVNKRGKVVYTYDPYKKKTRPVDIVKKASIVGILCGTILGIGIGFGSMMTVYQKSIDNLADIAYENKFEQTVDDVFVKQDKKMAELDEYMKASEEVSKEEYNAYLKAKKDIENKELFGLATSLSGGALATLSCMTYLGTFYVEPKKSKGGKKKKKTTNVKYDAKYDEGWTKAEIDIPICTHLANEDENYEKGK